jgi:hypothetical protein
VVESGLPSLDGRRDLSLLLLFATRSYWCALEEKQVPLLDADMSFIRRENCCLSCAAACADDGSLHSAIKPFVLAVKGHFSE